ncbi:hypothetical protein IFM89_015138 [Coptis chinensis]|uniref:tRNA-binding domain-containing protein n=1 Tax=Coptis chinensis TaxID=261450 RepID=A0A835LZK3_9MAGN|nr:hypothetical protein IFM89_015138 [Coptis chinensis]
MMPTFNEDDEWVRNVRLDACLDEESNCSDIETDICVEPIIVNLEDLHTSDGESEGGDESFEEGDKNEREEVGGCDKEDMNSFNQPGARENGEGTDCEDENEIMFSMRFKTSGEAYDFYNEYAKFVGFSVRRGIRRFNKDVEHKGRFLCSCEGPSINLDHLGNCARSADLSEEEEIHSTSGACGLLLRRILIKGKGNLESTSVETVMKQGIRSLSVHGLYLNHKVGPRKAVFDAIFQAVGRINIIAEDLGVITEDVVQLRKAIRGTWNGCPSVCPLVQLLETRGGEWKSFREFGNLVPIGIVFCGVDLISSHLRAQTAIVPMQDILGLGSSARMNIPKNTKNTPAPEVSITTLDICVGIITDVTKHPDVDSLYVQEIDVAEETPRTVVSSLVKYIPLEEMQVELVDPPYSVPVGERVKFPGFQGEPINGYVNLNIFEKLQADLHTDMEVVACYKDAPFTTSTGVCKVLSIYSGAIRHCGFDIEFGYKGPAMPSLMVIFSMVFRTGSGGCLWFISD